MHSVGGEWDARPANRHDGHVQISARAEYAVRAMLALAANDPTTSTAQALADEQGLPRKFLEAILSDLRRGGLVRSQRGAEGGYRLARPADSIAIGEVLRVVDGPLAGVRGERPEAAVYAGAAQNLQTVWVAVRAAVRNVLDEVTLADVLSGNFPSHVSEMVAAPGAWAPR
ncbi:rrf2 family protein, putative transcriptional regulator [Cryptosporangium arvum DSM 44712]|uniref:Rrf2 family protein, putative transcriptional regulator n=1 Tax=Cryptosporangium arvum DSM 44712 TaxID=927661 RepID=A0A010ZPK0_9ACTN|nr:rrf2 family protein, putative transcriptional regulator [Cryptosporangium arvum DSM 44712]